MDEQNAQYNVKNPVFVPVFLYAVNMLIFQIKRIIASENGLTTTPGGVLGISSDGDDRRIFLGLKFSIPGFFWVRKFGLGSLI